MFDLAQRDGTGPVSLKSIAERQDISEHYLEQLFSVLRKVELVKSVRGAQGGYVLTRSPAEITVGDIIRALEGPIAPVECVNEEHPETCPREDFCVTRDIWEKLRDSITEILDSYTLADLCIEAEKKKPADKSYMYYI